MISRIYILIYISFVLVFPFKQWTFAGLSLSEYFINVMSL